MLLHVCVKGIQGRMGACALYYTYKVHNMGKIPDILVEREQGDDSRRSVGALLQLLQLRIADILVEREWGGDSRCISVETSRSEEGGGGLKEAVTKRGGRLLEGETTGETLTSRYDSRCRETRVSECVCVCVCIVCESE